MEKKAISKHGEPRKDEGGGPRQKMRVEWETRAGAAELGEDNLSKERAAVYFGQIEG